MIQFSKVSELKLFLGQLSDHGGSVGFVPTMGALHQGHISLIKRARAENEVVVCSIFVNPIQFNNPDDLKKYPRTLDADLSLLESAGCDVVFVPDEDEMYPEAVTEKFNFGHLDKVMEGKFRPGHFDGVAVVVNRLFNMVAPTRAYFGLKDFQQVAIVKAMMKQTGSPVRLIACDIVREPDGLAMSSRNQRLSADARKKASFIYQQLTYGKSLVHTKSPAQITERVFERFQEHPEFELEYFEIVDSETLLPVTDFHRGTQAVACIAVWLDQVRLIDNLVYFE